ncbi:MAG: hypothetical protein QG671_4312 [Actinomycetota bacterium]|nr:hypothetical protein [Actinomycetota bacterium]
METRLADDFYLITHDDRSGALQVPLEAARLGLATALLAELWLTGHLVIYRDGVYPTGSTGRPGNGLAGEVLAAISDPRSERLVGAWIRFLAIDAVPDVRGRLLADGVLLTVRRRGAFGRRTFPPASSNEAAWAGMRIARQLSYREPLSASDQILTGIVLATGLLDRVLWDPVTHSGGHQTAAEVRAGLPSEVQVLLGHLEACVANAVLTALH